MIYSNFAPHLGGLSPLMAVLLVLLAIWTLIWKGLALWRAAHREEKVWYVILNTAGILEIIYLFFVANKEKAVPPPTSTPNNS